MDIKYWAIYFTGNLIFLLPVLMVNDNSNIKTVPTENSLRRIVEFLLLYINLSEIPIFF